MHGGTARERGRRSLAAAGHAVAGMAPELEPEPELVLAAAPGVPVLAWQSRAAALVALGTRGLGGFPGLGVGSTAVALGGRVACPLVVVRPRAERGPVVVGVDGSATNEAAIAFAFAEASARHTDLLAVHAWHDSPLLDVAPTAHLALAERLAGWQEKYPEVRVRREIVRNHPSEVLVRSAADARLVVVGGRARGGPVLGSIGQDLLHHAPCPTAIVPALPD